MLAAEAEAQPDDPGATTRLADAQAEDDPAAALATLDRLIARGPEPGSWDWRRILVATRLGRWDAVRDSAARLGMTVDGDAGPIDEVWEALRIEVPGPDEPRGLLALRTGPVTARIHSISAPEEPCHYGDEVIFDPLPLDGDEESRFYTYRCVEVTASGGQRAFVLDARHPGDAAVEALAAAVEALGGALRDVTGDYDVIEPDTDEALPGLYARIAIPVGREAELDALLQATCAEWPGPAVWTELLEALEARARLAAQRALMERWSM